MLLFQLKNSPNIFDACFLFGQIICFKLWLFRPYIYVVWISTNWQTLSYNIKYCLSIISKVQKWFCLFVFCLCITPIWKNENSGCTTCTLKHSAIFRSRFKFCRNNVFRFSGVCASLQFLSYGWWWGGGWAIPIFISTSRRKQCCHCFVIHVGYQYLP